MTETPAKKGPVVVSVLNLKGGVGKTTIAALLARYASGTGGWKMENQENLDVLAVDLDPQANLSQALMGEHKYKKFHDDKEASVVELFKGFVPPSAECGSPIPVAPEHVVKRVNGRLDIVPSRFDFSTALVNSATTNRMALANFIAEHMNHKDLVIIDCAPTESILTQAAYHASRYVLIPVRTEFLATIGFPLLQESLTKFRAENPSSGIEVCGVLINQNRTSGQDKGPHHKDAAEDIRAFAREHQWAIYFSVMDHSDGYPKWAKDAYANHLGNAPKEWPPIASEILGSVGLNDGWEFSVMMHHIVLGDAFRKAVADTDVIQSDMDNIRRSFKEKSLTLVEKQNCIAEFLAKWNGDES